MTDVCAECGFVYDLARGPEAGPGISAGSRVAAGALVRAGVEVRTRRSKGVWSPLEYGCHLRDLLLVQRERVLVARRVELPAFEPMGREERVELDGYAQQNPVAVARQLTDAADLFANVLSRLRADEWEREVLYNYPDQAPRPLAWVAVHTLHEVRHHSLDIERQLT